MALTLPSSLTRSSLTATEENLLFGRASEVATIVGNCQAGRLTVITSVPGLGLTSLLTAGAMPALQREGFIALTFADWQGRSLGARFRDAVTLAVHEQADGGFPGAVAEPLSELLARIETKTGRPVALLLDQFEDYLICHSGTDVSDDFDAELSKAIGDRTGRFVIGLHGHQLEELQRLSQYVPNLLGYSFELAPLTREAGRQLICDLAKSAEIPMEPAAADLLLAAPSVQVSFGAGAPGIHPLFAGLATERLLAAEERLKSKLARASTVTANGGAERLILESLDPVIDEMGATETELFFRWIPFLLSTDVRRLQVSENALVSHSGKWARVAEALLPQLLKTGLMRKLGMPMGIRYELGRESMTSIVKDWWTRKEAQFAARQRALFRVRSISIAIGAIVLAYLIYLLARLR